MQFDKLIDNFDKEHLLHPYTSPLMPLPALKVTSATGCCLVLSDGTALIDGTSSWWCALHGYNVPELNAALAAQLSRMAHVMFGGLTHEAAVALGKTLLGMVPKGLQRIFFVDSGSVAVEAALKMVLQYQLAQGSSEKCEIASIAGGYHGDTWNAMSVCDPVAGMHRLFKPLLPIRYFAPAPRCSFDDPWDEQDFAPMQELLQRRRHSLAAVIVEPVLQGAGGMRFYHPQYLRCLSEQCRTYGIKLIVDEIATGFGRIGRLFACEYAGICPDIMCIGKGLSGGYLPLAAVVTSEEIAQVLGHYAPQALMHGPTFMANPLACAVSNASCRLLLASPWQERVSHIEAQLKSLLYPLCSVPQVAHVRVLGAVGVVETYRPVKMREAMERLVSMGVWIRPLGRLLYVMPPFVISSAQLQQLCEAIAVVVQDPELFA